MVLNLLVENLDGQLLYYHLVAHSLKFCSCRTHMKVFHKHGANLEFQEVLGDLGGLGDLGDLVVLGVLGVLGDRLG